jgi:hypothetical protein
MSNDALGEYLKEHKQSDVNKKLLKAIKKIRYMEAEGFFTNSLEKQGFAKARERAVTILLDTLGDLLD